MITLTLVVIVVLVFMFLMLRKQKATKKTKEIKYFIDGVFFGAFFEIETYTTLSSCKVITFNGDESLVSHAESEIRLMKSQGRNVEKQEYESIEMVNWSIL